MTSSPATTRTADTGERLLVTLAGVAELAQVSRPAATMWRTRFATGADPFPSATGRVHGADGFDVAEVADWLARTGHGNNPDVRADAAAAALPHGFTFSDVQAVDELEALIVLASQIGDLDDLDPYGLREAAAKLDPENDILWTEIDAHAGRGAPWVGFVGRLIDAAYSPARALAIVGRRRWAALGSTGSAGPLASQAVALIAEATVVLAAGDATAVVLDANDTELAAAVVAGHPDDATFAIPVAPGARRVRRRALVDGVPFTRAAELTTHRRVAVTRIPADRSDRVADMLRAVDELALTLAGDDAAVVIGPARVLTDALGPADERARADVLRSGRVRGIARLAAGLVESAPREPLALWVLGAPTGEVPIAERFTVTADLTDVALTDAARADLLVDVVVSMGSARDVRAHAFRFARFQRTASLIARGGSLVAPPKTRAALQTPTPELPALIDAAAEAVRADFASIPTSPQVAHVPPPACIADLINDGHLRVIPGTRLDPRLHGTEGLAVVTASDLDDPSSIGRVRVDQIGFAAQHLTAALTRPGDVIFRTAPTAGAWVDADGSKVVAYPARVLRITASDPGGLVPEVIAADITRATSGPGAWRRWMLRRVAPQAIAPLRRALAALAATRSDLHARAARLDDYAALIVAGATTGAVTLTDPTPAAEPASHE